MKERQVSGQQSIYDVELDKVRFITQHITYLNYWGELSKIMIFIINPRPTVVVVDFLPSTGFKMNLLINLQAGLFDYEVNLKSSRKQINSCKKSTTITVDLGCKIKTMVFECTQ